MTEQEWLECADPTPMLEFLRGKVSDRKLRLFTCACVRNVWHLVGGEISQTAVSIAERFADGHAVETDAELDDIATASLQFANSLYVEATWAESDTGERATYYAALAAADTLRQGSFDLVGQADWVGIATADAVDFSAAANNRGTNRLSRTATGAAERVAQAMLLRDLIGHLLFKPVTLNPNWLTRTVDSLAQSIYDDRAFDRLPILADALEDAGCDNADILNHCRQPGEHVRGCWAVDLLLEKT